MKASVAISQEVQLDRLLAKLIHTVIEHAGAEKGFILKEDKGEWEIIAMEGIRLQNQLPIRL
ncbi:hypothetical protein D5R40_35125, partial [Okeania hirsuta]